ncbi:hypothetical protein [Halocalculus aciditolerans]|uniref:hypothetical protein n=1 Tax=Halocalculus aciditolerans TaxID=1383812 RepID=UPI00166440F3|nr:hypothetical protein [Halocalculus aciditolerans]
MHRRSVLAALGLSLSAGCSGPLGALGVETERGGPTVTSDPVPDALRAAVDVAVTAGGNRRPVVVTVAVTNDTAETQSYRFGGAAPWSALDAQRGPNGANAVLAPGGRASEYAPDNAGRCARATGHVRIPGESVVRDLAPGSTLTGRYALLAPHDATDCLPAGTYRWRANTYLGNADWGFTLRLPD